MSDPQWKNRIVGYRDANPTELAAHPLNFRVHTEKQANGLRSVIDVVGMVDDVIVSKRTGRILDGHLRVELAVATGQETIPVKEVDLSEEEERLVLATFDPIGEMAKVDKETLSSLLGEISTDNEGISEVLQHLKERSGLLADEPDEDDLVVPPAGGGSHGVRTFNFEFDAKNGAIIDRCLRKLAEKWPQCSDPELFLKAMLIAEGSV